MLAAFLAVAGAMPAAASPPPPLPALVEPASHEHHPGKIVYAELVTPDLEAAKRFYGGLFGWTFRDVPLGARKFAEALLNGQQVAGLMQRPVPGGKHRPAWLTFISVQDADAASASATRNGAKLLFGPRDIPDLGRIAVLADPQGAVFAILASSSGDPPDIQADDGDWIWSSLITSDPDTASVFYRSLFGYTVYDLAATGEAKHLILASGDYARASVNPFPSNRPDLRPRWLNYVRVGDVAAAAARVTSLGGHVLVPPRVDRDGSMIAVVADPLGASFGLLQWPDSESAGEAK